MYMYMDKNTLGQYTRNCFKIKWLANEAYMYMYSVHTCTYSIIIAT